MAIRKPDDVLRSWLTLLVIVMTVGGWIAGVQVYYDLPQKMFFKGLMYAGMAMPVTPALWVGPVVGLIAGITLYAVLFMRWKTGFDGASFMSRLRGAKMVSHADLKSRTKSGKNQLVFAATPVPQRVVSTHFFVGGSTGVGKSVLINDFLDSTKTRAKTRLICVDPDGGFMKHHYRPGDKILNPFDARTEGWSIFNEIRADFDCDQYAMAMIPRSPSTDQEQWNSMARTIVTETLAVLLKNGEATTERMLYWLTQAPNEDLQVLLQSTPAAGCFHGAEDTLASIRTVLTRYVTPHKFLPAGTFSIRDWLENQTGNLWITWRDDMLEALRPLISCWVDVTCAAILSMRDDPDRGLTLVADELDSLEKLNYLPAAATKGRKKGLTILAGIQSLAQLDDRYGKDDAMTLRNCFRSIALLGVGELDSYTAKGFSEAIGEHQVVRQRISTNGGKRSVTTEKEREPLVDVSTFHLLPNLIAYVKFAGDYPVSRVQLKHIKRPLVIEGIVLSKLVSEPIRQTDRLFGLRG